MDNKRITKKAYAKINLSLDVLGKLPNGYHQVKMVMQTIDLYDELSFEEYDIEETAAGNNEKPFDRIILTGGNDNLEMDDSNLIYKAAKLLLDKIPSNKGVKINLDKNIPIAAGMAGGSTDAAATLHGINEIFSLGMSEDELCDIGVKIGADVPYCIKGGTMLAEGIGEKLTRLPNAPQMTLVVAKPLAGVSTKYVYEHLDALTNPNHPDVEAVVDGMECKDIRKIAENLGNILEEVTIPALPEVAQIKDIMKNAGADGVLMSGSGPTVFSIFTDEEKAKNAENVLKNGSPATFVCMTTTVNR